MTPPFVPGGGMGAAPEDVVELVKCSCVSLPNAVDSALEGHII